MDMTGFDPEIVYSSMKEVKGSYEQFKHAVCNDLQNKFVNPMATMWACKEAQEIMLNYVKEPIDLIANNAEAYYQGIFITMNQAGRYWANATNTSYSELSFNKGHDKIDVSGIKENIDGVRGIDLVMAEDTVKVLDRIEKEAENALNNALTAVLNCGFIGGDSAETLSNTVRKFSKETAGTFKNIIQSIEKAIKDTVSKYADTEGQISKSFSNINIDSRYV